MRLEICFARPRTRWTKHLWFETRSNICPFFRTKSWVTCIWFRENSDTSAQLGSNLDVKRSHMSNQKYHAMCKIFLQATRSLHKACIERVKHQDRCSYVNGKVQAFTNGIQKKRSSSGSNENAWVSSSLKPFSTCVNTHQFVISKWYGTLWRLHGIFASSANKTKTDLHRNTALRSQSWWPEILQSPYAWIASAKFTKRCSISRP